MFTWLNYHFFLPLYTFCPQSIGTLGIVYGNLGNPQKAKELLERALAIQEEHYGSDHFEVARILINLGNVHYALGDPQKKKELLERALPIFEKHYGPNHFEVAKLLSNLGITYGALGDRKKKRSYLNGLYLFLRNIMVPIIFKLPLY